MGFFSAPKLPMPPPPPTPPTIASPSVNSAAQQQAQEAAAAEGRGFAGTLETSPEGTKTPSLAKKTLGG